MGKPVCAVVGVGPGNGAAFARRFAGAGYAVAALARGTATRSALAAELPDARAYACDVADAGSIEAAFGAIRRDLGDPEVVVYNAGSGVWGTFDDVGLEQMEQAWRVNTAGLLLTGKQVVPAMKQRGRGAILVVGATASLRGGARFTAFAAAKAAQRSLAQSMARHLGPSGIHVALLIIDGMVNLTSTRQRFADLPDAAFLAPDAIAEAGYQLVQQSPTAWTFELDLRPAIEKW